MEDGYRIKKGLVLDRDSINHHLKFEDEHREVMAYCRNMCDILEESLGGEHELEIEYCARDSQERQKSYSSFDELKQDVGLEFDQLEAHLESSDGLKADVVYTGSKTFPDDNEVKKSCFYDETGKFTEVWFPPELYVDIEVPESYGEEEIEKIKGGIEVYNNTYSQTL